MSRTINEQVELTDAMLNDDCDTVKRQAAIDALDEIETEVEEGLGFQYGKWRKYFSEMPSAQPERKRGKWIKHPKFGVWECDQCGTRFKFNFKYHSFCPNCGADMRGEKNE